MSMNTSAFYTKAKSPSKSELESKIKSFGYDLKFINDFESIEEFNGECVLNGIHSFVEAYPQSKREILADLPEFENELRGIDQGISFISGSNFIDGATTSVICLALMELSNAKVLYLDDEMWYTKEMLEKEIPRFLEYEKSGVSETNISKSISKPRKKIDWIELSLFTFILIIGIGMVKEIISWHFTLITLVTYVGYGIWKKRNKNA